MDKFNLLDSEVMSLRLEASLTDFNSSFNFLNVHNGFRRGKLHLLMGSAGSGKSSVVRSILIDTLKMNKEKNVLLFLSEETIKDFKLELAQSMFKITSEHNLFVLSEQENEYTEATFFNDIETAIREKDISLLIFDNITTSKLYNDIGVRQQGSFIKKVKQMTNYYDIATLLIAHTNAEISDNSKHLINENHIRGSKNVVNLVEFFYIMQRFQIREHYHQTIRLVKHRSQNPGHKMFRIKFDSEKRIYYEDYKIDFNRFKEMYAERDKL